MDLTDFLIQFKDERRVHRKKRMSISLNAERLKRLNDQIDKHSRFYSLLPHSEQMDFLLFLLENFMINNPHFDLSNVGNLSSE